MRVTCARCGRTREDEETSFGDGFEAALVADPAATDGRLFEGKAWAVIDGDNVCPLCITSAEERDLAYRYIELVEREIERVRESGEDPGEHEAPLVSYALLLRARLESLPPPPPPPRGGGSAHPPPHH